MVDESTDPNLTDKRAMRWEYIGSVIAGINMIALPLFIGLGAYGVLSLSAVPFAWFTLFAFVVIAATTWTFGKSAVASARAYTKGLQK